MNANIRIKEQKSTKAAQFYKRKAPLLTTAVDSLKVRIPTDYVTIQCAELADSEVLHVNSATGRVIGSGSKNKRRYEYPTGVSTPYTHEYMRVSRNPKPFVTVGLSSKLLKQDYFQGITINNIEAVYSELMRQGVIDCTLAAFLSQSYCTDVDIKRDRLYKGTTDDFKAEMRELFKQTKAKRKKGTGGRVFTDKGNIGIEFSDRRATSYKTAPYLKIYHKGQELLNRSHQFAAAHLGNVEYSNVFRIEATIKNRKHFRSLYGDNYSPTLENVLRLNEEQQNSVFQKALAAHVEGAAIKAAQAKKEETPDDVLKGQDRVLYRSLQLHLEAGLSIDELVQALVLDMYQGQDQVSRNSRSKYKRKLYDFYELILQEKRQAFCPVLNLVLN